MKFWGAFWGLVFTASVNATIEADFTQKIEHAEKRLQVTQAEISAEKAKLADELRKLEQKVLGLREQTSVARRQADEKTLSLQQLENRLTDWVKQAEFQQNLLDRFLQRQGFSYEQLSVLQNAEKIAAVKNYAEQAGYFLRPNWQPNKVILPTGQLVNAQTLSIGPITWFVGPQTQVGLADQTEQGFQAQALLPDELADTVIDLQTKGSGHLPVDASLGRAFTRQQSDESTIEHLVKGGIWVVPIVFFACLAVLIGLFKVIQMSRLAKFVDLTPAQTEQLLHMKSDVYNQIKGMQQKLVEVANSVSNQQAREDHLFIQLQKDKTHLEKWLNVIAVTAAVAPLLGLLGTVSGMIETFKMMTAFGSSDPEVISGGIAKALITTELGLVVAIPALILNAVLSRWARKYYSQLESFAIQLSANDAPKHAQSMG
ncbi:MotA/TolQ/ExbB proton channel family protein [Gayadomonas joobiniege]|uniref:MotA/TolQ/ExbB proton channel family protein n=1 Tax=Gayadomonas joobiniege TaxID=1234606 RepID=UPI00037DAD85|nr:MotA/TolQ/ExbB proton channel family protein [Gayadomonas joobiniege]